MLLKFKITEDFQLNDWAEVNIHKMRWGQIPYDITDGQNKFYFFRYVSIDNRHNVEEPRYFPLFLRNYKFHEQSLECQQYIIDHQELFKSKKLIPVVLDPLEGFHETTPAVEELAKNLKDICKVYLINGNNLLSREKHTFDFYVTNHWIHHLKDTHVEPSVLEEDHKIYISLNRMAREHRVMLTSKLINNGLRDSGYITWANGRNHKYIDYTENYPEIQNEQFDILDVEDILKQNPTMNIPVEHCNKSFLFLVTETHFKNKTIFISEKTFKPILLQMPFVSLGNPGTLSVLKDLGFKTFDKWIDESYDTNMPLDKRCDIIVSEINRLSKLSSQERLNIRTEMADILEHNYNVLKSHMKRSDLVESLMDIGKQIYTDRK